jgi:PAS domain S-box-containing protein
VTEAHTPVSASPWTSLLLDDACALQARGGGSVLGEVALGEDVRGVLRKLGLGRLERDLGKLQRGAVERSVGAEGDVCWRAQRLEGTSSPTILLEVAPASRASQAGLDADLFRQVFAQSMDGVAILDARDGTYLLQNSAHERLVGYTDEELDQRTPAIHLDAEDFNEVMGQLARSERFSGEVRSTAKDGTRRWIELVAFTVRDQSGASRFLVGIKRDVTSKRRTEQDALFQRSLRGTVHSMLAWNRADLSLAELLQGSLMELLLIPWLELTPQGGLFLSDPWGEDSTLYRRVAATNLPEGLARLRFVAEPKPHVRSEEGSDPFQGEDMVCVPLMTGGQPQGVLLVKPHGSLTPSQISGLKTLASTLADMIVRRRTEDALQESEARFRELAGSVPGIVYQYELAPDGTGSFPFVSETAESMLGLTAEQIHADGQLPFQQMHPDDLPRVVASIQKSAEDLSTWNQTYRLTLANGEERWHRGTSNPRQLENGAIRWSGMIIDVTEHKLAEEALRLAKEAAEAATRAKSRFLANVSHELRTPMNAVIGMAELLEAVKSDEAQIEYCQTIRSSADALLLLINDLLDVTRIESDELELEEAPFKLRELVEASLAEVAGRAAEKGLSLAAVFEGSVPSTVVGDRVRIRQVLVNLLTNAVKFTQKGDILVTVALPERETRSELVVKVRDTGVGIPSASMHLLFEPFRQVAPERQEGGTGLGLAISRGLLQRMGGRIAVESEVGKGSEFSFTCPVSHDRVASGLQPRFAGRSVVVVNKVSGERRMFEQQCERWGLGVHAFATLEAAEAHLGGATNAGVLFVDAEPQVLRELSARGCSLPVVPLLAVGRPGPSPEEAEALGVAGRLRKPVRAAPLLNLLLGILEERVPPEPTPVKEDLASEIPLRILVVEDHRVNLRVATQMLARLGYEVRTAVDGLVALRNLAEDPYDLVFMDVQMPKLDGLEATRRIRNQRKLGPRIVAMTASASAQDRRKCLQAGMDGYLSKPVRLASLRGVIQDLFRDTPPVDPEWLLRLRTAGGDRHPNLLAELAQAFQEDAPELMASIHRARRKGPAALSRAAHALMGTSLSLGGEDLARACQDLETWGSRTGLQDELVERVEARLRVLLDHLHMLVS